MAAEDEGRTEEPSEHRLEQARKEGRVAKSQEISSALILLLTITVLLFMGKWMLSQCLNILTYFFSRTHSPDVSDASLFSAFLINFLEMLAPVAGVAVVAGITANIIQNKGFIFSTKPIEPNFNKIVPKFGEYFRKTVFSGKGLFNIAKSILKVTIIVIGYLTIRKNIFVIIEIVSNGQILPAVGKIASTAAQIVITVAVLFLALSIPDFFVQRREFRESMKMTKQEVKQEYKELEGDPEVKGRLQQMQRQLLAQNIPKAVKEADVVITNPTHYAVVLKYDEAAGDEAPKVTAKGEDQTALYIKQLAKDNGIPIQEDRPLARSLYTDVQIGAIIPGIYWKAIALVYSHIQNKSQANEN